MVSKFGVESLCWGMPVSCWGLEQRVTGLDREFSARGWVTLEPLERVCGVKILPHINCGFWHQTAANAKFSTANLKRANAVTLGFHHGHFSDRSRSWGTGEGGIGVSPIRLAGLRIEEVFRAFIVFEGKPTGGKAARQDLEREVRQGFGGWGCRNVNIVLKELKNIMKTRKKVLFEEKTCVDGQETKFFVGLDERLPLKCRLSSIV